MNTLPVPPPFDNVTDVGVVGATVSLALAELADPEVLPAASTAVAVAVTVPSLRAVALIAATTLGLVVPRAAIPATGPPPPLLNSDTLMVSVELLAGLVAQATL